MATAKAKAKTTAKKKLVIVESPSKAKTIGKFLGSGYKVVASVGHVRDLPKSRLGIVLPEEANAEEGKEAFDPQYINIRGKGDVIKELKKEAKKASRIYLATDPDREGEAISWHLAFLLGIDIHEPCRVVFNEITGKAVKEAIKNPRPIDLNLVDAQQARRVLDRLVGYQISPLLWEKISKGLSAGRVQSAALRIICDREKEIQAFVPEEYWTVTALFRKSKTFEGKLFEYKGKKTELHSREESDEVLENLKKGDFTVETVEEKERRRKPAPPFTTSSLQQDASNKLNFTTKKTMMVAQQLYEGLEIKGRGTVGLVSYIRTDSVRLSDEARAMAKEYIFRTMGEKYYGGTVYSNGKKEVQDAHEAIRPSNVEITPEEIKDQVTREQYNLYRLIWQRFVASQMSAAMVHGVKAVIANGDYRFKATGSKITFDGFLRVYSSSKDLEEDKLLPELEKGEKLDVESVDGEQNFTQPPSRYTEATLVKELEEKEIGRPSTYAPIVGTLSDRRYIKKEKKYLVPTDLGFTVTDMLSEYFKEIVDVDFTAQMERKLDDIEATGCSWKNVIVDYYDTLKEELERAHEEIDVTSREPELTGENCELCGRPLVLKHGRYGDFIACSGYPECKFTKTVVQETGVKCPQCGGDIIVRRSKRGKIFYGCSNYPECKQAYWNKPVNEKCPVCGSLLVEKKTKSSEYACSNTDCNYKK
ncbi:MAG: type I DNA topoisomerase [Clostridiales bacterium]|nr:type I DNA topoisomerase [Clostridiales bacterium]MDD7036200.1 type I DNA topoisomerase [Bacillota bacterium]MDY2920735.1 type I DNA topoisomerase [Lentihominibacter sp.]